MSPSEIIGVLARVGVGAVLLFAGFEKLRSSRWPALAAEMHVPKAVIVALPSIELFLGLALVLQIVTGVTGWMAFAMFGAFTIVVTVQYASGSTAPCNCFGGKGEEAVSLVTIARNVGLMALAIVAALY